VDTINGRFGINPLGTVPGMPFDVVFYPDGPGTITTGLRVALTGNPGGAKPGAAIEFGWRQTADSFSKIAGYWDGAGTALGLFTAAGVVTATESVTILGNGNVLIGTLTDGMTAAGSLAIAKDLAHRGTLAGFYNHVLTVQQVLATGAGRTVDDVITALQTLGLAKQA
jgi:hypothetical protein